jgi:hypothetical protein
MAAAWTIPDRASANSAVVVLGSVGKRAAADGLARPTRLVSSLVSPPGEVSIVSAKCRRSRKSHAERVGRREAGGPKPSRCVKQYRLSRSLERPGRSDQEILIAFASVMFPVRLTHTSPLIVPGTFRPLLSDVTPPTNLSAVGSVAASFTYPGQCFGLVLVTVGAETTVVLPLVHVTVPPVASAVAGSGSDAVAVALPLSLHPLTVIVPATVPLTLVHVIFPFGPPFAHACPEFRARVVSPEAGIANVATSMNSLLIQPPLVIGLRVRNQERSRLAERLGEVSL